MPCWSTRMSSPSFAMSVEPGSRLGRMLRNTCISMVEEVSRFNVKCVTKCARAWDSITSTTRLIQDWESLDVASVGKVFPHCLIWRVTRWSISPRYSLVKPVEKCFEGNIIWRTTLVCTIRSEIFVSKVLYWCAYYHHHLFNYRFDHFLFSDLIEIPERFGKTIGWGCTGTGTRWKGSLPPIYL